MKVKNIVSKNFQIFSEKTSYLEILKTFEKEKLEYGIIKNHSNEIVGIVTLSDLFCVAFPGFNEANYYSDYYSFKNFITMRNKNLYTKPIKEIMTKTPEYVDGEQSVFEAAAIMKAYKIKQLPVYQDKEFIGVLTIHDLLKKIILTDILTSNKNKVEITYVQ